MNLAIQGHANRGNEVISYLKMLGGKNPYCCTGLGTLCAYYIIDGNIEVTAIEDLFKSNEYILYSLEGILAKFPYKVGDKVWLHYENSTIRVTEIITCMRWCNKWNCVLYDVSTCRNLRESAFTLYKEGTMDRKYNIEEYLKVWEVTEKRLEVVVNDNFELKEDNGKFYIIKKQPKYPKTYEECCKVLTWDGGATVIGYNAELIGKIQRLILCRNAYWRIAGKQMGLGKPWEPDWSNANSIKSILYTSENKIYTGISLINNYILAFPTEEMRDAFYENFKELIEACKELL